MDRIDRILNYDAQELARRKREGGMRKLTPRQRRRINKKSRKGT